MKSFFLFCFSWSVSPLCFAGVWAVLKWCSFRFVNERVLILSNSGFIVLACGDCFRNVRAELSIQNGAMSNNMGCEHRRPVIVHCARCHIPKSCHLCTMQIYDVFFTDVPYLQHAVLLSPANGRRFLPVEMLHIIQQYHSLVTCTTMTLLPACINPRCRLPPMLNASDITNSTPTRTI